MNAAARRVIEAGLQADPAIDDVERRRLIGLLERPRNAETTDGGGPPEILTRLQVAQIFKVTAAAVDKWARQGLLQRVYLPGRKRALGYRRTDAEALIVMPRRGECA